MKIILERYGLAFYKMLFEYEEKLRIPHAFIANHGECLSEKVYNFEIYLSQKTWNVKMEEEDGHYWFTEGWPKFVQDCGLKFADLLIFQFTNGSRIRVTIFETTGCEKTALPAIEESVMEVTVESEENIDHNDHDESEDLAKTDDIDTNEETSFAFTWKRYMRNNMPVKGSLVKKMELNKINDVKMRNLKGDVHNVKLYHYTDGRSGFGGRWAAFVDASDFVLDQVYKFEFMQNESGEILVQMSQELA